MAILDFDSNAFQARRETGARNPNPPDVPERGMITKKKGVDYLTSTTAELNLLGEGNREIQRYLTFIQSNLD